jgi:hypothetical protein
MDIEKKEFCLGVIEMAKPAIKLWARICSQNSYTGAITFINNDDLQDKIGDSEKLVVGIRDIANSLERIFTSIDISVGEEDQKDIWWAYKHNESSYLTEEQAGAIIEIACYGDIYGMR